MKFSIAVPSLNHSAYLRSCLRSIAAQEHEAFEVLIADGGSVDDSLAIISEFTSSDPRFRLVSEHDLGHGDAVAKALAAGDGALCAFLNADDVLLPHALAIVGTEFSRHPEADVVSGGGMYIDAQGDAIRKVRLNYHPLRAARSMRHRTALLQPATFWRRPVMDHIQLRTDAEFSFDTWFFFDAWKARYNFRILPDSLAGYRLHDGNKSLRITPRRIVELARLEEHKFGLASYRGRYLRGVASLIGLIEQLPASAQWLKRAAYFAVNSVSFASAYRLPGI